MIRLALALLLIAWPAAAGGPSVECRVVRVIDGDSLIARCPVWPGIDAVEPVRIRGIDTPELRGACPEERAKAREAKALLARLAGATVRLEEIGRDRYGRVLARVYGARGELGEAMIGAGLARAYDGGRRLPWCGS